jgi:hypothetical protein
MCQSREAGVGTTRKEVNIGILCCLQEEVERLGVFCCFLSVMFTVCYCSWSDQFFWCLQVAVVPKRTEEQILGDEMMSKDYPGAFLIGLYFTCFLSLWLEVGVSFID